MSKSTPLHLSTAAAIQGAPLAPAAAFSNDCFFRGLCSYRPCSLLHSSHLGDEQSSHAGTGSATERVAELEALEAVAACMRGLVPKLSWWGRICVHRPMNVDSK